MRLQDSVTWYPCRDFSIRLAMLLIVYVSIVKSSGLLMDIDRLYCNHVIEKVVRRYSLVEWLCKRWLALLRLTEIRLALAWRSWTQGRTSNIKDLLHPLAHPNLIISSYAIRSRYVVQAHQCVGSFRPCKVRDLQVLVVFIWQRHSSSLGHLLLVRVQSGLVDCNLGWCQSWGCDELKSAVSDQFSGQPKEWLLEVVVGLRRDIVVLKVLLSVECDCLGLDLSFLHVDLVAAEDDRDVLANTNNVTYAKLAS